MNGSSSKAYAINALGLWSYARRLLHAFAEAGQPPATGLQRLMLAGPNGSLTWMDVAQIDRSEPYADGILSIPEKSLQPVDTRAPVTVSAEESAVRPVYTPLEAPMPN